MDRGERRVGAAVLLFVAVAVAAAACVDEQVPIAGQGCDGEAVERAFGARNELLADLSAELDDLEDRIASDSTIVDLNREWVACMAESGFDYRSPSDMEVDISERSAAFLFDATGLDMSATPDTWDLSTLTLDGLDPSLAAQLAAAEGYEIDVAVADVACSAGYDETYRTVSDTYELEFVASHAGRIAEAVR